MDLLLWPGASWTVGFELVHPEYQLLTEHDTPPLEDALTPVYPTTDGLGQGVLRRLCEQALAIAEKEGGLKDWLEDSGYSAVTRYLSSRPSNISITHRKQQGSNI